MAPAKQRKHRENALYHKNLIKTAMEDNQTEWDVNLKLITLAYNTTVNESTGYTPFELTFGREANLPSSLTKVPVMTYNQLIENGRNSMSHG